jgi:hypothetical protein
MSIGDTCIDHWDFYFVLKMMPEYGEWIHVDVEEGTRNYDVLQMMRGAGHLFLAEEEEGFISRVSIAPVGQKFLERAGHMYEGHEAEGRKIIKNLTVDWEIMKGLREDPTVYVNKKK